MEDDLLGQAQAVLSGSTPKGGLLDEAMSVFDAVSITDAPL